jgi:hypothetical protein
MASDTPDFVQVQLTEAGLKLAGSSTLRVSNGRRSLVFTPGQTTKVERSYEWNAWLSRHAHADGSQLFEVVPPATTEPPAAK